MTNCAHASDATTRGHSVVLCSVALCAFTVASSISASLIAIPSIAQGLQTTIVYASWIPTVFLLSNLLAQLPAGRLADNYGRKRMFLLGSVGFAGGSLCAGLVDHMAYLLFFRIFQGVGSALMFSSGFALVGSLYQGRRRASALGWLTTSVYIGLSLGPLLGGWLVAHWSWRFIFFFPIPILFAVTWWLSARITSEWRSDQYASIDWWGALILSVSLLLFFLGMTALPQTWAIVAMLGAMFGFYGFIRHTDTLEHPLIRPKIIWQNRAFTRSMLALLCMHGSNYGLIFLLGLYFQYGRQLPAAEAGQLIMLQAMVMALLAPIAGKLAGRYSVRWLATLGSLITIAGLLRLLFMDNQTPLWSIAVSMCVLGVGLGLFATPNHSAAFNAVTLERLGIASALLHLARIIGQLLGTSTITLLFAIFIGTASAGQDAERFLLVTHKAIFLALFFAVLAAWYSWYRSKHEAKPS